MTPTKQRKTLEMARAALESCADDDYETWFDKTKVEAALLAIAEVLAEPQELWTDCVFSGSPPEQYRTWFDFVNAPVKSGVAISRLDLVARVEAEKLEREKQEPAYWIGPSRNLYSSRLSAVQNGEQMVTPFYLAPGAGSVPMTEKQRRNRCVHHRWIHNSEFETAYNLGIVDAETHHKIGVKP